MTRGTTPTIRWNLSQLQADDLTDAYMTIRLTTGKVIERGIDTATKDGNTLLFKLTQEETLQMGGLVEIQLRYTVGGNAGASPIYRRDINKIIKEGVI